MTNMVRPSVLITDANKGLGLEAARRLGEEGWRVFLGSRNAVTPGEVANRKFAATTWIVTPAR